jgi:two-component system OmpR family response regulator
MTAPSPLTSTAAPADRAALRGPDGRPIRVLVVDDEQSLSELVSLALRYEGWEVRSAADGMSAIAAARDFRPDLVVLDVMLPDIDGLEVCRQVRVAAPTPILMLTARAPSPRPATSARTPSCWT